MPHMGTDGTPAVPIIAHFRLVTLRKARSNHQKRFGHPDTMAMASSTQFGFVEKIRRFFGGMPAHVQVAALPWRRGRKGVEVLLVTSRGTKRWVIPKGWPEGEERLYEAAAREAREEAGVVGSVSPAEAGRYLYGKKLVSGMERRCEVHVFPLEVTEEKVDWPERSQRERRWVSVSEARTMVAEPGLSDIFSKVFPA